MRQDFNVVKRTPVSRLSISGKGGAQGHNATSDAKQGQRPATTLKKNGAHPNQKPNTNMGTKILKPYSGTKDKRASHRNKTPFIEARPPTPTGVPPLKAGQANKNSATWKDNIGTVLSHVRRRAFLPSDLLSQRHPPLLGRQQRPVAPYAPLSHLCSWQRLPPPCSWQRPIAPAAPLSKP